jgi:cell division transport system permease protein
MTKVRKKPKLLNTQFVTSCISTTLVLVLLGTIVLFVLTARNLSDYMRENINVSILLSDDTSKKEVEKMQQNLEAQPFMKALTYISKEDALKEECEAMGTDPTEFLGYNPFTASFEVKVNAEYANNDSISGIVETLKKNSNVVDVIYQKELMDSVNRNIRKLSMILLIIAALFTYISFALINNTIKLTIFSQRFIINTMKLVGASWEFIRRPFLGRAFCIGGTSALLADIIIVGGIQWLKNYEPDISTIIDTQVITIVTSAVFIFGFMITFVCTYLSLSKYLRMSSNELYHL